MPSLVERIGKREVTGQCRVTGTVELGDQIWLLVEAIEPAGDGQGKEVNEANGWGERAPWLLRCAGLPPRPRAVWQPNHLPPGGQPPA